MLHVHKTYTLFLSTCCIVCLFFPANTAAQTYDGVLADPVALGGWLYEGKCATCHGDYQDIRLAEGYEDKEELYTLIGSGGCRISWSRRSGGSLNTKEIKGLVRFMFAWEELDERPELPPLPPQPLEEVAARQNQQNQKQPADKVSTSAPLTPALRKLVESSSIIQGAWLYTSNCYRCHLAYEKGRMAKGLEKETIFGFISNGKTSTQMSPFSRMFGGHLKNAEIRSIVDYITTWENAGEPLAIATELMRPPSLDPADLIPTRLARFRIITGDTRAGHNTFLLKCSGCHGRGAEGYIGPSLQLSGRSMRPDLYVKSVLKKGIPRSLMESRAKGSDRLSPKEIDDVVAWVTQDIMDQ